MVMRLLLVLLMAREVGRREEAIARGLLCKTTNDQC